MGKVNIDHEFSLGETDETRNYLIEEIKQNESIRKNHKKVCKVLKYIEHLLILASTVPGFVSSFAFASLIGIPCRYCNFCSRDKNLYNNYNN